MKYHPGSYGNVPSALDWLDKRTMDPMGYKRINKETGMTSMTSMKS